LTVLVCSAMIAAAAAPSVTRSQGVGVCYPDGSAVKLTPPKFVQSGHDFTVVTDTDGSEPVSDLTLSVNGRAPAPIPAPPSAAQFPTPDTSAPTIRLVFAWTQGAGTAAACTGGQTFWVRVVPEDARVGAADEPRVSAIYAITAETEAVQVDDHAGVRLRRVYGPHPVDRRDSDGRPPAGLRLPGLRGGGQAWSVLLVQDAQVVGAQRVPGN
jgi:hypothetical protein